jgi:serine/threonine protein kinase
MADADGGIRVDVRLRGRYLIRRPLGCGAMGYVWEAFDEHLRRPVAVKTLAAGLLEPADRVEALRRFEREAQAAAGLAHSNVATVFDADITDETCWLVMELVPGATLGDLLDEREGRLGLRDSAAVAAQLCAGLSAVHGAGLVHRDLKPSNVMVRRDGTVKVLDFGLVKPVADPGPRLTLTGQHVGNLLYASPELIEGTGDLDGRSDLYSLGCLLHQMLTGNTPFRDGPLAVVARRHLMDRPPSLGDCGVDAPAGLEELLGALLAKSRAERPRSAAAVYAALGPFLPRPEPAAALPGGPAGVAAPAAEDPARPFVLPQGPQLSGDIG